MSNLLDMAKSNLVLHHPFYASIVLGLPVIEDNSIPTAATDGTHIYYNADFMKKLSTKVQVFVLAHEAEHIVRLHMFRNGARDRKKMNIAADHLINLDLEAAGFTLPPTEIIEICHDPQYKGMYTEQVYDLLPDDQGEGGMGGDILPAKGTPQEQQAAEQQVKQTIHAAAAAAKQAGKLPGHIKGILDDLLKPQVNWVEILQRFLTAASKTDVSWNVLNRRMRHRGLRLPSLDGVAMGEVAIVIDVSGSCYGDIPQFLGEVAGIIQTCQPERVHILWTDTVVMRHDEVQPDDYGSIASLLCEVSYGGGTNLTSAFTYMDEHGIEPVVSVVLTDGYTAYGSEPAYPTLWCMTTNEVAPWGETVKM